MTRIIASRIPQSCMSRLGAAIEEGKGRLRKENDGIRYGSNQRKREKKEYPEKQEKEKKRKKRRMLGSRLPREHISWPKTADAVEHVRVTLRDAAARKGALRISSAATGTGRISLPHGVAAMTR